MVFSESGTRLGDETRPDADRGGIAVFGMSPVAQSSNLLGRAVFLEVGQVQQG